jgi:chromosomal replication initiator protein
VTAATSSSAIATRPASRGRAHDDDEGHRALGSFTRTLAQRIGERPFAMWFERSVRFSYEANDRTLRVAVPNRFVADWIQRKFDEEIQGVAADVLDEQIAVDVEIDPARFARQDEVSSADPAAPPRHCAPRVVPPTRPAPAEAARSRGTLRHSLDDFIVGPSNELAHAAAERLAEALATGTHLPMGDGPLFLHGGCGLGKTHLLQGLCRRVLEQAETTGQSIRVHYTTGEQFTNDYITAVRSNKLEAFRRRMRSLDLLAVDDVHFIANKTATQQEFLHSFDQIELGGARVVLASDSHPKLIKQFSEALVSRCVRGLVVQINPPDGATRRRLVLALAERRGLMLQPSAAEAIAASANGSVREIEGLLTKLHALATLTGEQHRGAIGHALVDRLLAGEGASVGRRTPLRFEHVAAAVQEELGVTTAQLASRSRHKHVVLARALIVHLARQLTSMSFPEIAAAMGKPNHSTVITAAQRLAKQLEGRETVVLPGSATQLPLADLVERLRRTIERG